MVCNRCVACSGMTAMLSHRTSTIPATRIASAVIISLRLYKDRSGILWIGTDAMVSTGWTRCGAHSRISGIAWSRHELGQTIPSAAFTRTAVERFGSGPTADLIASIPQVERSFTTGTIRGILRA